MSIRISSGRSSLARSMASAPAGYEDEMAAAMVALLNKVAKQARQQLNLAQVDELSLVGDDRTRLARSAGGKKQYHRDRNGLP
jgi:predicted regulator of Ras-like GTPase activity (Roadblock/LC7/MglB family)